MKLLYLEGDPCSLKYLLGAFDAAAIAVDHPHEAPDEFSSYDLVMLSDYRAETLGDDRAAALAAAVHDGLGLIMVGGWTSFGRGGYARSPLAEALPVEMTDGDDRRAAVRGFFPSRRVEHPILGDLDWERPPVMCGHNRVTPKAGAEVVLEAEGAPLLVLGSHGQGRVVAFTSDLAPHWSGGLTDWGESTVPGPEGEEMGTAYVAFLAQMVRWAARPRPHVGQERVERA